MSVFLFVAFTLFGCAGGEEPAPATPKAPAADAQVQAEPEAKGANEAGIPIRVGWQETWATQGQLAVILQQSEIFFLQQSECREPDQNGTSVNSPIAPLHPVSFAVHMFKSPVHITSKSILSEKM